MLKQDLSLKTDCNYESIDRYLGGGNGAAVEKAIMGRRFGSVQGDSLSKMNGTVYVLCNQCKR